MIIRCHQCDEGVTPDLLELVAFDAYVMCRQCAERNAGEVDDHDLVEINPDLLPTVVNLDGEMLVPMDTSPEGIQQAKEALARRRLDLLRELDQQLPLFRDAYLVMTKEGRRLFREYVREVSRLQDWEADGIFGNPFCVFRLDFIFQPLEPASAGSKYAGHYIGREDREVLLPKVLLAAMSAWDQGRNFHLESVAEIGQYE